MRRPNSLFHVGVAFWFGTEHSRRVLHGLEKYAGVSHVIAVLAATQAPIKAVAAECGEVSEANFCRFIRLHLGMTPSECRRRNVGCQ
jgi:AraC-like DNA-binding protein